MRATFEKAPPLDGKPTASAMKEAMQAKLHTDVGDALYRRRKAIVEPVHGQVKNRGLGALSLRGLHKARGEWSLIALTHNLLKLHKARRAPRPTPRGPTATAVTTLFSALRQLAPLLGAIFSSPPPQKLLTATGS